MIDKEGSESCHSYETEFSFPSESAPAYEPKLTTQDWAAGTSGTWTNRTLDCPTGQKLVHAQAGYRSPFDATSKWPGAGTVGFTAAYQGSNDVAVYDYRVDGSGVLTGAIFRQDNGQNIQATVVCTP